MKFTLLVLFLAAFLGASSVDAQLGRQMALSSSPGYDLAAQPLRSAPPRQYTFTKAVISDVMRLLAEDAGIGFFGLPDGVDGADSLVTFTIDASPFVVLETLAKANGISLIHENGIWYLRPANDQELIGRIYEINYNAQEIVTKNRHASLTGGGGRGGSGATGLDLQGAPDFFVTEPSRILEDIRNILDIPIRDGSATFAPTTSIETISQLSLGSIPGQPRVANVKSAPTSADRSAADGTGGAKVIWNSDSNTLYVVAGRQQHQWIEVYLASADRPQPMIAVEVKFIETSCDPSLDLGIEWSGALDFDNLGGNPSPGVANASLPTAVLSYRELNHRMRTLYNDTRTKSVSYPRMVTLDNREVSFRSVINQPVLGSSSSASLGAGSMETSSVEYLPIGTVINVLPKRMADDMILLNVSVTVSAIVGTEIIGGNPFPIATSRVYTAPLTVKSGYTVAVCGLDAASTTDTPNGVPILARIPLLGHAFRMRQRDHSRQHLMMLITPVALDSGTEGLTKKPITRDPWVNAPAATRSPKAPVYDASPVHPYPVHAERIHAERIHAERIHAEPIQDVPEFRDPTEIRKANQTFGRSTTRETGLAVATVVERETATNADNIVVAGAVVPVASSLNTPMIADAPPAPELVEDKSVAAAGVVKEGELESTASSSQVTKIAAGVADLKKRLGQVLGVDSRLSSDEARMVMNVHEEAQILLDEVDEVRGDKRKPLRGELGDVWWDLIKVKTHATKIRRRSSESLALNTDGTAEE